MSGIFTATNVAAAASLAGTGASVAGSLKGGQSTNAGAQYQAAVARNQAQVQENNAKIALQNADYVGKVGMENASVTSMKGAATSAKIKAGITANNITPTGSAADVLTSQREINNLNSENVLADAGMKAYGYNIQATNDEYSAANLRAGAGFTSASGTDAETGGYLKAGGTLLSGLKNLPTGWFGSSGAGGGTAP